jgi:hypothetical protein
MLLSCLLVEIAVLVSLAIMERLPHFLVNVVAGFIAVCFLAFLKGDDSFFVNLGVCALLGFFACMGAIILWCGVRFTYLAKGNLRAAAEAIDTVAMESAVAKSLAGRDGNPNSYGNRRVAEEVVRALKNRNPKE